jgi:phosphatidylglycerol:prolipoprotein diacylglycerol transferase
VSPSFLYSLFVALGIGTALLIRQAESRRLGYLGHPGYRHVGAGCLIGGALGSKLGMALFLPVADLHKLVESATNFDFGGKTILGAIAGGYLGGEVAKKVVGVRFSTGDALAIALPVGQAIGRLGCFFGGCCYGTETSLPWAVFAHGARRHPVQLYEMGICLATAAVLWCTRRRPARPGWRFRSYLIVYALTRTVLEEFRGDSRHDVWPMTPAQAFCLSAIAGLLLLFWLDRRCEVAPQVSELKTQGV